MEIWDIHDYLLSNPKKFIVFPFVCHFSALLFGFVVVFNVFRNDDFCVAWFSTALITMHLVLRGSEQSCLGSTGGSTFVLLLIHNMILGGVRHLRYKEKRWDVKRLVGSGGMPSSHSATVMALTLGIALRDGVGGSLFALSLVLASVVSRHYLLRTFVYSSMGCSLPLVLWKFLHHLAVSRSLRRSFVKRVLCDWQVMYDASGVRLQAGRQAEVKERC